MASSFDSLVVSVGESGLKFIASLDCEQDVEKHHSALTTVLSKQNGVITADQYFFPYEVIELGANALQPGREAEFALCT